MKNPAEDRFFENIQEYEEIDELVEKFQKGDRESGQELLNRFEPLIKKYKDIIKSAKMNMLDKDVRIFLGLFISNKENREKINHPTKEARKTMYGVAEFLSEISSSFTEEDMMHELQACLLLLASRFEKRDARKTFCGYVYNAFRYEVYRRMVKLSKEPMSFSEDKHVPYHDLEYDNEDSDFKENPELYTEMPLIGSNDGSLDNDWVMGHTCKEEFLYLNEFQRLILKFTYQDRVTDTEIQNKLGMHRHTIRQKRNEALRILRETLGDEYEGIL